MTISALLRSLPWLICVTAVASADLIHAQRPGSPIVELPAHGHDLGIFAQFSSGSVLPSLGRVKAYGGAIDVRYRRVTLTAGGAVLDSDSASSGWTGDGALGLDVCEVFRAASMDGRFHFCDLLPNQLALRLRAGIAHSALDLGAADARMSDIALGAAVAFTAPIPILTLELWTAPRLHVRTANGRAGGTAGRTTRVGAGLTIGLAVTSTSGLGANISIDELLIGRPPGDKLQGGFSMAAGIHFVR